MLEIIAMLTMAIDHIGLYFFPQDPLFRIIGRIAMPIYAFGISQGFHFTRNKKSYAQRLLILAAISQIPYFYLHDYNLIFNIIFTFSLGLLLLVVLEKEYSVFLKSYVLISILVVSEFLGFEYGSYAILLILIYRYANKALYLPLHILLVWVYVEAGFMSLMTWYSLIATALILIFVGLKNISVNRTFYRLFYPVHLFIIALVLILLKTTIN